MLMQGVDAQGVDLTLDTLFKLKDMGVSLAIDDFGSGHSSLDRLRSLPVEVLKIDRSFLREVPEDPEAAAMVVAMVHLADGTQPEADGGRRGRRDPPSSSPSYGARLRRSRRASCSAVLCRPNSSPRCWPARS